MNGCIIPEENERCVKAEQENATFLVIGDEAYTSEIIEEYNRNAEAKTKEFNDNAVDKTNTFNTNAINKTSDFNTNYDNKVQAFNNNATTKTEGFDANATLQTNNFNSNATQKTEEFNQNAGTFINKVYVNGIEQTINNNSVNIMVDNGTIYGIKRAISNNSSSAWERTDSSVGLVANATHDGSEVQNDFDNIYPWSQMKKVNYDTTNKIITARYGDANFKEDGTNGEVMITIPEFYLKIWQDTDMHIQCSPYAIDGFTKIPAFMIGAYPTTVIDGKAHSYSDTFPEVNRNITSFRTLSSAVGDDFGQLDYRYFILQILYLIEYADFNTQNILGQGVSSLRVSDADKALIGETNINRIVISTASATNFIVGQNVSIGTSAAWNWNVAKNRTITSILDYSEGEVVGKAIYFDGDPVNIVVGNVLWSTAQKSGQCDSLGNKSGCLINDGKHSVCYRGIENFFGNIWQFVDGLNIKDNVAYVCYNPSEYKVDTFSNPYVQIGYINANTNGYAKTLGYDKNNPLIALPIETGGSNSTYICDYYYQNTGNRIVLVGGNWSYGAGAGAFYWHLAHTSSYSLYYVGSRLLKNSI